MRGSHPGTLLSSASTLKEPNNNSVDTNTAYSNRTGVHTHTKVVSSVSTLKEPNNNSVHTNTAYSNRTGVHTHTRVVRTNSICGSSTH